MSNCKYVLNATEEQIEKLYQALSNGSPIKVALSFANIQRATFYYWREIASVVAYVKEKDIIKSEEELVKSGVDMSSIQEQIDIDNQVDQFSGRANIMVYKEPTGTAILRYKNNRSYQAYADKVYEIIRKCDELQSSIVLKHLQAITDSINKSRANTLPSQWFLERVCPDTFAKVEDRQTTNRETNAIPSIQVEFIKPDDKEQMQRVKDIEDEILYNNNQSAKKTA